MSPEKILAIVLLVSLMLHTGLQVNVERLRAVLSDYGLLARAFVANFIAVPIYGVLAVRGFHLGPEIATGVLLMAISPGVPFVVLSGGRKKGGSLGLAVSLAFLMPAISIITVPITASLVLPGAQISASSIVVSLALFQLLPLLVGILMGNRFPSTERLQRILGLVVLVAIIALLGVLGPGIVKAIASVYGSLGIWASVVVVILALLTGWLLGGSHREYRRTMAVGTALRNIGLAAVLATTSFGGGLVAAMVLVYFLVQIILSTLIGVVFTRVDKSAKMGA